MPPVSYTTPWDTILTLPILPPLRANLDASELGRETWLETAFGKPHTAAGFGNIFRT